MKVEKSFFFSFGKIHNPNFNSLNNLYFFLKNNKESTFKINCFLEFQLTHCYIVENGECLSKMVKLLNKMFLTKKPHSFLSELIHFDYIKIEKII